MNYNNRDRFYELSLGPRPETVKLPKSGKSKKSKSTKKTNPKTK